MLLNVRHLLRYPDTKDLSIIPFQISDPVLVGSRPTGDSVETFFSFKGGYQANKDSAFQWSKLIFTLYVTVCSQIRRDREYRSGSLGGMKSYLLEANVDISCPRAVSTVCSLALSILAQQRHLKS